MKKIFYSALAVILAAGLASCSEEALNTAPTTSVSTDGLYESASTSLTPLNGIYRSMYTAGWSTGGNTHQCFGISAYNLAADVMATAPEDVYQYCARAGNNTTERNVLFPIPNTELTVNKLMTQNPGW